jgi:hypothetical protein
MLVSLLQRPHQGQVECSLVTTKIIGEEEYRIHVWKEAVDHGAMHGTLGTNLQTLRGNPSVNSALLKHVAVRVSCATMSIGEIVHLRIALGRAGLGEIVPTAVQQSRELGDSIAFHRVPPSKAFALCNSVRFCKGSGAKSMPTARSKPDRCRSRVAVT